MLNKIERQLESLYWECGARHDMKAADIFYNAKNNLKVTQETIFDCIELLKVSGKNTKELVREKLMDLVGLKKATKSDYENLYKGAKG